MTVTDINDENNIIIARQQQRRGLKQDLPQPLRPGEFGWAVDSQQLYIGADPTNPAAADYNNASTFETTVNARPNTISIANNQIIAFTVPFVKYSQAEYNGITTVKSWNPTYARSTISSELRPECKHTSADFAVFSPQVTQTTNTDISIPGVSSTTIYINGVPTQDDFANIRVGDIATVETTTGTIESSVTGITFDTGTGDYIVELDQAVTTSLNANVSFRYNAMKNIFTGQEFTSADVTVKKSGVKLSGEANSSLTVPSAAFEYTFSTSNSFNDGVHQLVLRTAPTPSDTVSLNYYDSTDVRNAILGNPVTGNVSAYVNVPSFYTEFNIPEYRQIPEEFIQVSDTTGLGFVGLQNKHVQSVADSTANVDSITSLTLGNLLISRNDNVFPTSNCDIEVNPSQYTVDVAPVVANQFSPVTEQSGAYRYNRVKIVSTSNLNRYFHNRHFDVLAVNTGSGSLTFELPTKNFSLTRSCNIDLGSLARYPGNGYTGVGSDTVATIKTDSDGIRVDDWVRIVDAAGTNELHDTVFKAIAVRSGQVDIRVDASYVYSGNAVPTFSANHTDLLLTNHGGTEAEVNTTVQAYSVVNELTGEVGNINISSVSVPYASGIQSVDNANITTNTFFLDSYSVGTASALSTATGSYIANVDPSYDNISVVPVLAINLNANTSLAEAVTTINKPLVATKLGLDPEQIFPQMDYVPGQLNRVFITQDPGYSSIAAGGLDFSLFEDRNTPTLSVFKLPTGEYNRNTNTVRAKLEKWMNQLMQSRDVNLFSSILLAGDAYKDFPYTETDATNRFYNETITSAFGIYNLTIDDTYGDVLFCDREEASIFNTIVNTAYYESPVDRNADEQNGVRGLLNNKNNIEIQTREQAGIGATFLNFPTTSQGTILRTTLPNTNIITLPSDVYNCYIIEYSMQSVGATAIDTYTRAGTLVASANFDINEVAINDRFSSVWNKVDGAPVVEPRFIATIDGTDVILQLEELFRDPLNPTPGDTLAHSFDADLLIKFVARRWSSLED